MTLGMTINKKTRRFFQSLTQTSGETTVSTRKLTNAFEDAGATVQESPDCRGLSIEYNNMTGYIPYTNRDHSKCHSSHEMDTRLIIEKILAKN